MNPADIVLLRFPLALWVGGAAFSAVAAPAIFREIASHDLAGTIFDNARKRLEGLFHVLSVVLVIGVFSAVGREGRIAGRAAGTAIGIFLAIATNVYASMVLRPRMAYYRAQAGSFDDAPEDAPWRRKFQALHRRSTRVAMLGLLSAAAALFFAP